MTSYVIVAIPTAGSDVWKVSSEKVPHLTLCFLGDKLENIESVTQFVGHVADVALNKFYLDVERRGPLGENSADVLFFNKSNLKNLEDLRTQFLTNLDIFKAYNSTPQYETWTPHLTLGYPETPANSDDGRYLNSVSFDRIALWTGDYEGVEFMLKNNDLAMMEQGDEFLQHFGVKGMKWGVIREKFRNNAAVKLASASEDHKRAHKVKMKAKVVGVHTLTNKDLQDVISRMNLEVSYKNLKKVEHDMSLVGIGKKWVANFVTDVLKDGASSWIKRPGSNFSGRTSSRARGWVGKQPIINGQVIPREIGS